MSNNGFDLEEFNVEDVYNAIFGRRNRSRLDIMFYIQLFLRFPLHVLVLTYLFNVYFAPR